MLRTALAVSIVTLAASPPPSLAATSAGDTVPDTVDRAARVITPAGAVAPGGRLKVRVTGLKRPVRIELRTRDGWQPAGAPITVIGESTVIRAPAAGGRTQLRFRARGADDTVSPARVLRVRPLTLAAVGDINLGDGPGAMIDQSGASYPWSSVGPRLRAADIAFGNLECAISLRGSPQDKTYTFRGRPSSVRAMRRAAGIDIVNLANNHSGDYGKLALLDTLRTLRANDVVAVGAGATEQAAYRPQMIEKLGLRVAFVGFSTIMPFEFRAVGDSPGSAWGFPDRVRDGVRRAAREADVVIATFHWGIELDRTESAEQRELAQLALASGATAVIGAHPHVLQPIRRPPARLIAYSLGNFVFSAVSPGTQHTGILELRLTAGAVTGSKFVPATIRASRPVLR